MAKRRRFTPEFKAEVVIEALSGETSQAELCRHHNLSADQLSKWKHQLLENAATLFESTDKQSDASTERIAQLEQLVGRLTLALEIKKSLDFAELNPSEQRHLVETLRTDYRVFDSCGISAKKLVLTLLIFDLNKRWHFSFACVTPFDY